MCTATGSTLSTSTVSTAAADVNVANLGSLVSLPNTVSTTQTTQLMANGGANGGRDVVTTAKGGAANVSLLGGSVQVAVADPTQLTARASGVAGGAHVTTCRPRSG